MRKTVQTARASLGGTPNEHRDSAARAGLGGYEGPKMKTTFEKLCEHIKTTKARQPLDPFAPRSIKWLSADSTDAGGHARNACSCLSCVHCSVRTMRTWGLPLHSAEPESVSATSPGKMARIADRMRRSIKGAPRDHPRPPALPYSWSPNGSACATCSSPNSPTFASSSTRR